MMRILALIVCVTLLGGLIPSSFTFATKEAMRGSSKLVRSVSLIGAPEVWKEKDGKNRTITGKGIKVAIIDSGIDMKHPDFKGKKISGYDFERNTKRLMDDDGHGTHVSGIIHKVAPDTSFLVYRVGGIDFENQFQKAVDEAIKNKADVINISLREPINVPSGPLVNAVNRAVKKGIVVVAGVGNEGPFNWTVGSPAASSKVITVGASSEYTPCPFMHFEGGKKIELLPLGDSSRFRLNGNYGLYCVGTGEKRSDYKQACGKVVLVERSKKKNGKSLYQISKIADEAGAVAVVVYNHSAGEFYEKATDVDNPDPSSSFLMRIPTATLAGEHGTYLKKQIAKGKKHIQFTCENKERICTFSSRGPVLGSWAIKPDVVAPGEDILSALPKMAEGNPTKAKHERMSGTSMACPHVAGAVALMKQARPTWTPEDIKAALSNTAIPLKNSLNRTGATMAQGAGRINVHKAIHTETLVMPNSLSFGNHQPNTGTKLIVRRLLLKNMSKKKKFYSFWTKINSTQQGIHIEIMNKKELTGKSSASVPVKLRVDTKKVPQGIYSGSITVKERSNELRVPFVVIVEPKGYSYLEGLKIEEEKGNVFTISYYLPITPDHVEIIAHQEDSKKKYIIGHLNQAERKKGYHKTIWKGKDLKGRPLPDGPYKLNAKVVHLGKTSIPKGRSMIAQLMGMDDRRFVINHNPPSIILRKPAKKNQIQGYIFAPLSLPENLSWKSEKGGSWRKIGLNYDDSISFSYTFKKYELKPGKNIIILRVEDNIGNVGTKKIVVENPK